MRDLLRRVSRAFYLSLRALPAGLQVPVGLAYLLARAADTISDTRLIAPGERLRLLLSFRQQIQGPVLSEALHTIAAALSLSQDLPAERELLQALPGLFRMLDSLPAGDGEKVRRVVVILTEGMESDLRIFPGEDSGRVVALPEASDLDRYIYQVAGCVGGFWTEIAVAHLPALKDWDLEAQSSLGIRFGKALQLVNVLRDLPRDLRIGRCYLPRAELSAAGLAPEDLLRPDSLEALRPVRDAWLRIALGHFRSARAYTLAIPRRCLRLRLAVFWPLVIGLETLRRVALDGGWLDPAGRVKVSRGWIYRMMALSFVAVCSNRLLGLWIDRQARRLALLCGDSGER